MILPNIDMASGGEDARHPCLMHPVTEMAITWLVRSLDETQWTEEDARSLQMWLEESPAHQREFNVVQATLTLMSRKELLGAWMAEGD